MRIILPIFLAVVARLSFAQTTEAYFASFPTLSPDGQIAVFTYDGDLWKVASSGGVASRLTAMPGEETRAHISPDGNWLAFSSMQYGNHDVYLMPMNGGSTKQLTYHEGYDHVDGWSWDSKSIYFTSNRNNRNSAYKVSVQGGTAIRLFENYFNTVHSVVEHPSSGEIFFNETWESKDNPRKRYKGAYNPDIQSFNLKTREYKKYTTYIGKDLWPSLDKRGKIYFASDEANQEYNLYTFDNGQKVGLTSFNTSIKYPSVNADGTKVIFEKDFQLYLYDVASKTSQKLVISIYQNPLLLNEKDFNVRDKIETMSVSPDGKKLAFVSRGELFVSDVKGKFVQQMRTNPRGRVLEVRWASDNKTLLYNQTSENGFLNLFTISADGKGIERQFTSDNQNNRDLTTNAGGTKGIYHSGRNEVRSIDLKTMVSQTLIQEELWGFGNPNPYLSPNDEYVMFTAHRNFEQDIFLLHIATKKLINLTQTGITETNPYWSPDGKYIYFTSDRINPAYPYGLRDAHIYRFSLEKFDENFRSGRFDSLFVEKPKEEKKSDDKGKKDQKEIPIEKAPVNKPYILDLENILDRIELVGPDFGSQTSPQVFRKDEKTFVLFVSNHEGGTNQLWVTTYEPFEKTKTEKIEGTRNFNSEIIKGTDKYYTIINGNIHTLDLSSKKTEKIDINFTFRKNLADEFTQMFYETWANLKENFYNEDFHGTDWEAMRNRYEAFLPFVNSRANLRILVNDMLGELNSSHLGFASNGEEEKVLNSSVTLGTGIKFDNNDPYKVVGIVKGGPADKKDKNIKPGDRLVAVNDMTVNPVVDRDFYFSQPSLDEEVTLTFTRSGANHQVKIHPETYITINSLLYDEWIQNNQQIVDEKSNKRIAYAHMRNMGQGELTKFYIDMNTEAYHRDGLILDLRYNTGGNVHDDVLRFLSQRPYLQWKYREGAFTVQPNFTPAAKPIVMLVNEQSLSDAEMTATGFKELKLGKLIGTETYRWIIFTSGKSLVDGSFYRLPAWGCYTLDGKNIEKEGVKPDIFVETNFKDRVENRDPQLDKAIDEILKDLN